MAVNKQSVDFQGYKIKPWSFSEIEALAPTFSAILFKFLYDKDLDFDKVKKGIKKKNEDSIMSSIIPLIFKVIPHVRDILKITLKIKDTEIDKLSIDEVAAFVIVILKQNMTYLKNFSSPFQEALKMITED